MEPLYSTKTWFTVAPWPFLCVLLFLAGLCTEPQSNVFHAMHSFASLSNNAHTVTFGAIILHQQYIKTAYSIHGRYIHVFASRNSEQGLAAIISCQSLSCNICRILEFWVMGLAQHDQPRDLRLRNMSYCDGEWHFTRKIQSYNVACRQRQFGAIFSPGHQPWTGTTESMLDSSQCYHCVEEMYETSIYNFFEQLA